MLPAYFGVSRQITRMIVAGIILLTLSGSAWLFVGYPFTPLLIVKLVLVAAIWILGPLIDNVVEPKFQRLAPTDGALPSPAFAHAQKQFLAAELVATLLFYVIVIIWVVRI